MTTSTPTTRRFVRIVKDSDGTVGKESDVTGWSDRQVEKLINGMSINLDWANWHIVDTGS